MAGSVLLLEELLTSEDDRFLAELLAQRAEKRLGPLAERLYKAGTPFARRTLLAYADQGCDTPAHRPFVKRLYKLAEAAADDELLAHFLVAFDRLIRHKLRKVTDYDWRTRTSSERWLLRPAEKLPVSQRKGQQAARFSIRSRLYLQRRVFRYFRALARKDEARYLRAICAALALYEDEALASPEQLLDARSLLQLLYWGSPVLVRDPRAIRVAEGRTLAELSYAPYRPESWKSAAPELLTLLTAARSRPVRLFAKALLERHHAAALTGLPFAQVRALLTSPHEEVQLFAAGLLKHAAGLGALPLSEWLALLELPAPSVVPLVCALVKEHVSPSRLSLAQCVELACSRAAPVAELGLAWAKEKPIGGVAQLEALLRLRDAEVAPVRAAAIAWVGSLLSSMPGAKPEHLRELLDARHADVRALALVQLGRDPGYSESTTLWAALAESPYEDARSFLVLHLGEREAAFEPGTLRHVWASALLAVHRGGRAKREVARRIAARIERHPSEAGGLLPLLGVALRSLRAPERSAALAAVVQAAQRAPSIAAAIARALPDLAISPEVAR